MRILLVGNGGREHALLWKLARDAPEAEFFITGGNGGTAARAVALPLAPTDVDGIARWAARESVDLVVVGPEAPLAEGLADALASAGVPVFGPSSAAARIESSKAFAKELMKRHGIPTAEFAVFEDLAPAEHHIREHDGPLVVKASGLAAGKGAVVCGTTEEALSAASDMLGGGAYGEAGARVVIEERMEGEELSIFALCDGDTALAMLPAQDHKRIGEGDIGPNTGGMGAYAPVSIATPGLVERTTDEIIQPTVSAMAEEGHPFRGLLYAGIMLTDAGPRVVEFNCRFGDPETQVILPLLEGSLLEPMLAIARGDRVTEAPPLRWRDGSAVTTVLAVEGYPGDYPRGMRVEVDPEIEARDDVLVFHAGTALRGGELVTSGGRVLAVTGLGRDVAEAAERSRWGAERIRFEHRYFRRDIGWREVARR